MPSVDVSVFIITWYLAYGLYILGCLMGGESNCKGKGQAVARRRRAPLAFTALKTLRPKGRHAMTFRRLNGEWRSDQAGISLWVWAKPTCVLYFL